MNFILKIHIQDLFFLLTAIFADQRNQGTNCTPVGLKTFVPAFHSFYILFGVSTICKYSHNINNREVPLLFLIVLYGTNLSVFKQFWHFVFCHIDFNLFLIINSIQQILQPCLVFRICFFCIKMFSLDLIFLSFMSIYLCGGSCIEDVTTHLMCHLSLHPTDTVYCLKAHCAVRGLYVCAIL